jgi:hypothetical protein
VRQPVPPSTRATLLNLAEGNAAIEALATPRGILFLDFNRLLRLKDSDFCDYHHLSPTRVAAFNSRLFDELANRGLL